MDLELSETSVPTWSESRLPLLSRCWVPRVHWLSMSSAVIWTDWASQLSNKELSNGKDLDKPAGRRNKRIRWEEVAQRGRKVMRERKAQASNSKVIEMQVWSADSMSLRQNNAKLIAKSMTAGCFHWLFRAGLSEMAASTSFGAMKQNNRCLNLMPLNATSRLHLWHLCLFIWIISRTEYEYNHKCYITSLNWC